LDGSRFHEAYFSQHPGMWTHGDLVEFDADGSARLYGRSDGVMNVNGVRIGPSEIYTIVRGIPGIRDAMAVEIPDGASRGSSRLALLVVLAPTETLDPALEHEIRGRLRREASASHVPGLIVAVPELPVTHNGKKSERAVTDALSGRNVRNLDALRNPGSIDSITAAVAAATQGDRAPVTPARQSVSESAALQSVIELWRSILGVQDVGPDDEFADLGGTSREVLIMLRRLRLELGVDLPILDFTEAPTPRGVARRFGADASAPDALVTMSPGIGPPLTLIGDAWGQLDSYYALVRHLELTRPVQGLRLELGSDTGARHSVRYLARVAAQTVAGQNPGGPHLLSGYSFGALVAHQAAVELLGMGERVELLALLDPLPPAAGLTKAERLARLCSKVGVVVGGYSGLSLRQVIRERLNPAAAASDQKTMHESAEVYDATVPLPYPGLTLYFLAASRSPGRNLLAAWQRWSPRMVVTEVPGTHDSILSEANVGELAWRLRALLELPGS
jgi:acetoacetyl-CoA synthetase